jgi:lipid A 3-O-deacylase
MIRKTALAAALVFAIPAQAFDSISLEGGRGDAGTELWRAGMQWKWDKKWFAERSWTLGGYWDLEFGRWSGQDAEGGNRIWDLGLTPVFRLERTRRTSYFPYVEAAIGFHVISNLRVNSSKAFSSNFQFGDHIGVGVRYGERYRYDIGLRLQHLSNAGLKQPNPGINFWELRLAYHWD